jgi:hypothetical protein
MAMKQKIQLMILDKIGNDVTNTANSIEIDDVDMSDFEIKDTDKQLMEKYLMRFTINKDNSINQDIDISLMIKALPNRSNEYLCQLNEMFCFQIFQESLVAFQNQEMVLAFEYFDQKNSQRVQVVRECVDKHKKHLTGVSNILDLL